MKAQTLGPTPLAIRAADLLELTKPRITLMVVITAAAGFLLASTSLGGDQPWPTLLLVHTLIGTALVAAGASALNQFLERRHDATMIRTADRPLPAGRLDSEVALVFAVLTSIAGIGYLAWGVNLLTALLGAVSLAGYVFVYTPLKRISSLSTVIGAFPGAVPPLMGWAAVRDSLDPGAWALFGLLFVWQLPHFLAIAWLCREDYERAGYPMLPVIEPDGKSTSRQAVIWAACMIPVGLLPSALGLTGSLYGIGATLLGIYYLRLSWLFARQRDQPSARRLLLGSVLYLPGVFAAMLLDRLVAAYWS